MCLIIHREIHGKRGSNVPNDILDYNRRINPDGFGIAWRDEGGELRSMKFGPADYSAFHALLKQVDKDTTTEYVAHFRKATHGPACMPLSHPFSYKDAKDGQVLVFHNGVINIATGPAESDTQVFVNDVLSRLQPRWWTNPATTYLVEKAIGWSRLLVMTGDETIRLNQSDWKKLGGIWYSTFPGPSYGSTGTTRYGNGWTGYTSHHSSGTTVADAITSASQRVSADNSLLLAAMEDEATKEKDVALLPEPLAHADKWLAKNGHTVSALYEEKVGSDRYGVAICDQCDTEGQFYTVKGRVYIDVSHEDKVRNVLVSQLEEPIFSA